MPFENVNGARLYYETLGEDQPGRAPLLLIHGSTRTGHADWGAVAPLLARRYRVILPDCRGHGQSSNPGHSYSFKEMADDAAALVRALGYPRAHVIGHSNGGNVALVTLLEHPEVVQSAVIQAANAWVSPDLVEKEPDIFDPERVAREAPQWMNEMIALHGATHGQDYWRDLLQMTVQEIITQPNYTAEDLGWVQRPALVVQGELDRVNAPARHAQFIARHIPDAELWIPSGVGHSVHEEALFQWVEKVEDFLRWRGDDDNEALYRLGRLRYPDRRGTVFALRAERPDPGEQGGLRLTGQVLEAGQRQAALDLFAEEQVEDRVQVLLENAPWALVKRPVTDLRSEPGNGAERVSQALLGEALRILEERQEWSWVRLERDGYLGWIHTAALHCCSQFEVESYQAACSAVVAAELAPAFLEPPLTGWASGVEAGKLPFGVAVWVAGRQEDLAEIRLPHGERWWVDEIALLTNEARPQPDAAGVARSLALFRRFVGVPYLWGGRTPFGFDCSGFTQAFYAFLGVSLPRDADQQFQAGRPVEGAFQPGDLLFFGEEEEEPNPGHASAQGRRITHVAVSLGGDEFIHANGAAWSVSYNSFDPASPRYRAWLKEHLAGSRRIL